MNRRAIGQIYLDNPPDDGSILSVKQPQEFVVAEIK